MERKHETGFNGAMEIEENTDPADLEEDEEH